MTKAVQLSSVGLANGVATLDSNSRLTTTQFPAVSGDVTISAGSTTATLANSGVVAGTYQSSIHLRNFTVDQKGRITSAGGDVLITPAWSSITQKPSSYTGFYGSSAQTRDNITTRTDTGSFQTATPTDVNGWPSGMQNWMHLATFTHDNVTNYHSMQFAGSFYNNSDIFYRATNNSGTTSWARLWNSANDGSGSGLDADLLDGQQGSFYMAASMSDVSNTANKLVLRDTDSSVQVGDVRISSITRLKPYQITTTSTTETVLVAFSAATYACVKVLISATTGSERHVTECLITHNSTESYMTEYGQIWTGQARLYNIQTDIVSGEVRLKTISSSATSTVYKLITTLLVP